MDLSFKQVPLVLTSSQLLASPPHSGIVKKRKLSECSDSSMANSVSDKASLNEKFLELSLENKSKFQTHDDGTIKVEEPMSLHTITIPKPIKMSQSSPNETLINAPAKNDNFLESLLSMSQNDVPGISKYLNLDLNSKLLTWDKMTANPSAKEKFKMSSMITSFMNTPFNFPFMKPGLLMPPTNPLSDSQGSNSGASDSDRYSSKFGYKANYVGPLTKQQRQEKVENFLKKKQERKWKHIRYTVRKDLADKRERSQGRFVKTKMFSYSDLMEKTNKDKETDKMTENPSTKNNSEIIYNNLSLGSSLGKRKDKADLFYDS